MIAMRPRALKRRLVLVGLGGMLAAGLATAGVARADYPTVCGSLAVSPTVGTVEQLVITFVGDGLSPGDAGELIAVQVLSHCPQYRPVLERFIAAYSGPSGVQRA
jgi:hypothetical protein